MRQPYEIDVLRIEYHDEPVLLPEHYVEVAVNWEFIQVIQTMLLHDEILHCDDGIRLN